MTDNEIMKALECCEKGDCYRCPAHKFGGGCTDKAKWMAVDLINRQKAELEELQAEIDKQYEQAKADILGNMSDGGTSCHWCIEQHKAEAVKEFAERLKKMHRNNKTSVVSLVTVFDNINNLVKEMVGENK